MRDTQNSPATSRSLPLHFHLTLTRMRQEGTFLLHLLARCLLPRMGLFLPTNLLPRNRRALGHPSMRTHSKRISLPTLRMGTPRVIMMARTVVCRSPIFITPASAVLGLLCDRGFIRHISWSSPSQCQISLSFIGLYCILLVQACDCLSRVHSFLTWVFNTFHLTLFTAPFFLSIFCAILVVALHARRDSTCSDIDGLCNAVSHRLLTQAKCTMPLCAISWNIFSSIYFVIVVVLFLSI
jgi:hypothetical protein